MVIDETEEAVSDTSGVCRALRLKHKTVDTSPQWRVDQSCEAGKKSGLLRETTRHKTHFPAIGSSENLDCVIAASQPQPRVGVYVRESTCVNGQDMELANTCNGADKSVPNALCSCE